MEIGPFIVGLPIINGDFPELCKFTRGYFLEGNTNSLLIFGIFHDLWLKMLKPSWLSSNPAPSGWGRTTFRMERLLCRLHPPVFKKNPLYCAQGDSPKSLPLISTYFAITEVERHFGNHHPKIINKNM
jgi:hypothetical protein